MQCSAAIARWIPTLCCSMHGQWLGYWYAGSMLTQEPPNTMLSSKGLKPQCLLDLIVNVSQRDRRLRDDQDMGYAL